MNGHEVDSYMVTLDWNHQFKDRLANQYVKPLLEEWVGFPLEFTSFYGIREYYSGHWLRNHIDRIDVLVISATLSLGHFTNDTDEKQWPDGMEWPLEGMSK